MALYEHVFLARQDISQQQVDALVEQYKGAKAITIFHSREAADVWLKKNSD